MGRLSMCYIPMICRAGEDHWIASALCCANRNSASKDTRDSGG